MYYSSESGNTTTTKSGFVVLLQYNNTTTKIFDCVVFLQYDNISLSAVAVLWTDPDDSLDDSPTNDNTQKYFIVFSYKPKYHMYLTIKQELLIQCYIHKI